MTLEYLVEHIDTFDEELVIFQKEELSYNSEVVLFEEEDSDTIRIKDGVRYIYFLEIYIAKEIIEGTLSRLNNRPTIKDLAVRLLHYAIYDA